MWNFLREGELPVSEHSHTRPGLISFRAATGFCPSVNFFCAAGGGVPTFSLLFLAVLPCPMSGSSVKSGDVGCRPAWSTACRQNRVNSKVNRG